MASRVRVALLRCCCARTHDRIDRIEQQMRGRGRRGRDAGAGPSDDIAARIAERQREFERRRAEMMSKLGGAAGFDNNDVFVDNRDDQKKR